MRAMPSGYFIRATAAVLLAILAIHGCAPASVTSVRQKPHSAHSFEVPADYETVYERIARRARERYQPIGLPTYQPGVSAKLSPAARMATVTVWDGGGIGMQCMLTAEIRALDASRTQVDVYAAKARHSKEALLWAQWANTPLAGQ